MLKDEKRDLLDMTARVEAQFATLEKHGVKYVVLSAFGCGAFGNDPHKVSMMYRDAIWKHAKNFKVIAFAIYYAGFGENNFKIFHSTLKDLLTDLSLS